MKRKISEFITLQLFISFQHFSYFLLNTCEFLFSKGPDEQDICSEEMKSSFFVIYFTLKSHFAFSRQRCELILCCVSRIRKDPCRISSVSVHPGRDNSSVPGSVISAAFQLVSLRGSPADFELAQLQERLRETELVMEKIVSSAHHQPDRWVVSCQESLVCISSGKKHIPAFHPLKKCFSKKAFRSRLLHQIMV